MKTLIGTLLAATLMSTAANAWCPPGYNPHQGQSYGRHAPSHSHMPRRIIEQAPSPAEAPAPQQSQPDPAPVPAPEPVPQK